MAIRVSPRLTAALALLGAWLPLPAQVQTHEKAFDDYVIRSSVVSSLSIPEASAQAHGIERAPDRGILNVTVLKKGSYLTETVPARVEAEAVNLIGSRRTIPMLQTKADRWVSYTGTFSFAPREVLDFNITVWPQGSRQPLKLNYRERVWVDRTAPGERPEGK